MTATEYLKKSLSELNTNELFFAAQLYRAELSNQMSEQAYYKALERMVRSGALCKAAKGVYYIPNLSKFGIVPLSEAQIVTTFTQNEAGMETGYTLYRKLNLTTQVGKNVEIYSNRLDSQSKNIGNIHIKKVNLKFTDNMRLLIAGMEVMQHYTTIQDFNIHAFTDLSEKFAQAFSEELFQTLLHEIRYKKSTLAFAARILNYFGIQNSINQHLSALSKYRIPKMEDIYEIAHA